jgi:tetratricopeptide (TPR) repeat protein
VAERLRKAISYYQEAAFGEAYTMLKELEQELGNGRSRETQETHTYLGCVSVALSKNDEAVSAFERALAIQPNLKLPSSARKIVTVFEQARQRYQAKVRALDHDPPRITHEIPKGKKQYGSPLRIAAVLTDPSGVAHARLNYRIAGNRGYSSVNMEQDDQGGYVATIPTLSIVRPGIDYYIAAWDNVGNGPALKGSSGRPIQIEVVGGPLPGAPVVVQDVWYKKWWVWAIVAGAAAAAGTTAGLVWNYRDKEVQGKIQIIPPR